jgi:glycosyltransferase involved in cell wall biosynthesis
MGDAPASQSSFQLFTWKWIARRAHAIVAISDFMAQTAASHSRSVKKKTIVIRNVSTSRTSFGTQEFTPSIVPPKKSLQLVYVGQITPQKGLNELIEGVLQLNDPDVGCWIIGGSQHTISFETQLQERVKQSASKSQISFFGFIEDPTVFYAAADWHIAPSKYEEPLGNIVQEAKATGTPSIVSPHGGLPELIQHEVDGIILSEISASAIQQTIRQLQTTPDDWVEYGSAARVSLETRLNKKVFEQQWCKVLNKIT